MSKPTLEKRFAAFRLVLGPLRAHPILDEIAAVLREHAEKRCDHPPYSIRHELIDENAVRGPTQLHCMACGDRMVPPRRADAKCARAEKAEGERDGEAEQRDYWKARAEKAEARVAELEKVVEAVRHASQYWNGWSEYYEYDLDEIDKALAALEEKP